jgi:hypothetical protein
LAGLGLTVHFARNAWKESRKAAEAAIDAAVAAQEGNAQTRDFFQIERRPWVAVSTPRFDPYVPRQPIFLECVLTNVGLSPANRVRIVILSPEEAPQEMDPLDHAKFAAEILRARLEDVPGFSLMPTQTHKHGFFIELPTTVPTGGSVPLSQYVWGFVRYNIPGDQHLHVTPFIWLVMNWFDVDASHIRTEVEPLILSFGAD